MAYSTVYYGMIVFVLRASVYDVVHCAYLHQVKALELQAKR